MDQETIERWKNDWNLRFRELLKGAPVYAMRIPHNNVEETAEVKDKLLNGYKDEDGSRVAPFVCVWLEDDAPQRKEFDRMPQGSFVVFQESKGDGAKVHVGRVADDFAVRRNDVGRSANGVDSVSCRRVHWLKDINVSDYGDDLKRSVLNSPNTFRSINDCRYELFCLLNKEALLVEEKAKIIKNSKNVIFRSAPGTGKTYLAKQIAARIISEGQTDNIADAEDVPEDQWKFVHFHPMYEYSDFVEGINPQTGEVNVGVFKAFCDEARKEENSEKKYVFIIDEINRGELVDIFGELVYSIDPYYRGKAGKIATKYASLHGGGEEDFYVPENVYIIGTMNDVDESLYSFKCAMVRRFTYLEIDPKETQDAILKGLDEDLKREAIARMDALNEAIVNTEGWGKRHCIGATFFKNLEREGVGFDELWDWNIKPLLEKYALSLNNEKLLDQLKAVYDEAC